MFCVNLHLHTYLPIFTSNRNSLMHNCFLQWRLIEIFTFCMTPHRSKEPPALWEWGHLTVSKQRAASLWSLCGELEHESASTSCSTRSDRGEAGMSRGAPRPCACLTNCLGKKSWGGRGASHRKDGWRRMESGGRLVLALQQRFNLGAMRKGEKKGERSWTRSHATAWKIQVSAAQTCARCHRLERRLPGRPCKNMCEDLGDLEMTSSDGPGQLLQRPG